MLQLVGVQQNLLEDHTKLPFIGAVMFTTTLVCKNECHDLVVIGIILNWIFNKNNETARNELTL